MIQKYRNISIAIGTLLLSVSAHAVVGYNRFIPWLPTPHIMSEGKKSYITGGGYLATASHAYNTVERHIGLPELYGSFDLGLLSRAYEQVSGTNPLRAYYQDKTIPFFMEGALRMQGFTLGMHQAVTSEFAVGGSIVCSRFHAHIDFILNDPKFIITEDMKTELLAQRRLLFNTMGIREDSSTLVGMGDIDLYCYFGNEWDRLFKFHTIKAGVKAGLIFPTALSWDIAAPATIFTDNNRYWGFYGAGQATFILREDLTVDFGLYLYKRMPKTFCGRMPVLEEPLLFGAATGLMRVNPGLTVLFCPTVQLEHLRNGFGVAVSYSLLYHQQDRFTDRRVENNPTVTFRTAKRLSSWGADYISLQAFYDFSGEADYDQHILHPTIKLKWDLPTDIFVAKRVAKTHLISLTIDCAY